MDLGAGCALRLVARAGACRLTVFGAVFFRGVEEALRAVVARVERFTGVFAGAFLVFDLVLALVAMVFLRRQIR
jgi:preprotein translocase subunit SecG